MVARLDKYTQPRRKGSIISYSMSIVEDKYIENILSLEQIDELIKIYNTTDNYQTTTMKKLTGGKNLKTTMEVLSESDSIDIDKITVCHFYKHKTPYYPHTDFHSKEKENLVIPLKVYDGPNPYLVIFDQYYNEEGRTWTFNKNINFEVNKTAKCRPYDFGSSIKGLLDEDISDKLYEYLDHYPKNYWYGLSGTPYEFKPGNAIQFDSKKIHSTSKMHCTEKLGLTIRYSN